MLWGVRCASPGFAPGAGRRGPRLPATSDLRGLGFGILGFGGFRGSGVQGFWDLGGSRAFWGFGALGFGSCGAFGFRFWGQGAEVLYGLSQGSFLGRLLQGAYKFLRFWDLGFRVQGLGLGSCNVV